MKRAHIISALSASMLAPCALGAEFTETFDAGIPATWSIVDNFPYTGTPDYSAVPWTTNAAEGLANFTSGTGMTACASSENHPGQYDVSLITPAFIAPAGGGSIQYKINYRRVDAYEALDTNISINGGDWVTMIHQVTPLGASYSSAPPNIVVGIGLSFYGVTEGDTVRIEFRYYSEFLLPMVQNEYVEIDDVRIYTPIAPPACPGDVTGDGITNIADFNVLAGNFGLSVTPDTGGDLNGDGLVNIADFNILAGDFGCEG